MSRLFFATSLTVALLCGSALAVDNLLTNPGFRDTNMDEALGDGWTTSGDVFFFAFFGDNPHASFFADTIFHQGRLEQEGIVATPGVTYQFDMMNTRIEANFSPDFDFGLEYYDASDVKIGETIVPVDYSTRLTAGASAGTLDSGGAVNGAVFSVQGVAVPGTVTVRPVMQYNNVTVPGNQTNAFLFNSHLAVAPGVGDEALKNSGFEDTDGDGFQGDFWSSFGAAGFGDDFSGEGDPNGHATLFAETAGNSGGVFQQSILAAAGAEYEFSLTDVRIEANVNGSFEFGFEFYGDDDTTKLGESFDLIDISTTGDGLSFTTSAVAIAGATFVRPMVRYSDVLTSNATDSRVFIFDASLAELSDTIIAGDYNADGVVNSIDYAVWRENLGSTNPLPNDPIGGTIGQQQFETWKLNFGSAGTAAVLSVAAPEPTTALLLVTFVYGIAAWRLRRC